MMKFVVEGHSPDSAEGAIGDAMAKAAAYVSSEHDVHLALNEVTMMPGRGWKAVVEVTIIPLSSRDTLHKLAQDVELRHELERDFRKARRFEEQRWRNEIASYCSRMISHNADIPGYFMAAFNEADLLNKRLEKEFFRVAKTQPPIVPDIPFVEERVPGLKEVLGRRIKPETPDPEPS